MDISKLTIEKSQIKKSLENLNYGSIEIRENGSKKYIYVHYRDEGLAGTKYVGEYSQELHNLILENNKLAKELKKRVNEINKELSRLNYVETELDERIELNLDLARRNLVNSIYKQAILEGVATTYSDTEEIVNGGIIRNMTSTDVEKIINLKHAWEFIMNKNVVVYPSNYSIVCQINSIVEEGFSYSAGKIRSVPVSIGGSSYIPPIPFEDQVKFDIEKINKIDDVVDRAIDALLYVMKKQIFIDGNKRTAVLFANHILMSHGKGLIVIPAEDVDEYKALLIQYYETNQKESIVKFIKEKCCQLL